jgi:hypothetical protein
MGRPFEIGALRALSRAHGKVLVTKGLKSRQSQRFLYGRDEKTTGPIMSASGSPAKMFRNHLR